MPPRPLFASLVERAVELAAEWHEGTYRKCRWRPAAFDAPPETPLDVPVMAHVTTVALTVQRAGWGDEVVAAAFLHDVLEDRNRFGFLFSFERLVEEVGEGVARLVAVVTEPKRDAAGQPLPWRARKEAYLAGLAAGPPEAAAISLADKLHNAWAMSEALAAGVDPFTAAPGRRAMTGSAAEQRWFLDAVLAAAAHHADTRLVPMRERLAEEIARFAHLAKG